MNRVKHETLSKEYLTSTLAKRVHDGLPTLTQTAIRTGFTLNTIHLHCDL